jgi:hypothetical protein
MKETIKSVKKKITPKLTSGTSDPPTEVFRNEDLSDQSISSRLKESDRWSRFSKSIPGEMFGFEGLVNFFELFGKVCSFWEIETVDGCCCWLVRLGIWTNFKFLEKKFQGLVFVANILQFGNLDSKKKSLWEVYF